MSRDEFYRKFRGRLMLFMTEAWCCRRATPSELGMIVDAHHLEMRRLLSEMYDALNEQPKGTSYEAESYE